MNDKIQVQRTFTISDGLQSVTLTIEQLAELIGELILWDAISVYDVQREEEYEGMDDIRCCHNGPTVQINVNLLDSE